MREEYYKYLDQAQYLVDQNHVHWCTDVVLLAKELYKRNHDKKAECLSKMETLARHVN